MLDFGILRLVSLLMDCSCIAPRTPTVIVIRGFGSRGGHFIVKLRITCEQSLLPLYYMP